MAVKRGTCAALRSNQSGNTIVLMTVVCLLLAFLSLAGLDVFSILVSRRVAQTEADAAATAAVRVMQPIILHALLQDANDKAARLVKQGEDAWSQAHQTWDSSRQAAARRARRENTDEKGNVDGGAVEAEMAAWLATHPEPQRQDYVTTSLSAEIHDSAVVAFMVGQTDQMPEVPQYLQAALTPSERGCSVQRIINQAITVGQERSAGFIRDPHAAQAHVTFPYEDHAWVDVEVNREVPTIFVRKWLGHPARITTAAGATLKGLGEMLITPCS